MYRPSRFSRSVFKLLELIAAGGVPKNGRNNPRIFNCLEILADALLASVRESVSGWNISWPQEEPSRGTLQSFLSYRPPSLPVTPRLGRRATGFFFRGLHAVALQVAVQAGSPNAQKLRGPKPVATAHLQHALNVHFAHFFERKRLPVVAF